MEDRKGEVSAVPVRSLAAKFSVFSGLLVFWVVATIFLYDLSKDSLDLYKACFLLLVILLVAGAISRYTIRLLVRPLTNLQLGIDAVQQGRLEPVRVSRTGDEIEFLGNSFNQMITALQSSQAEVREHRELLETRIQQRTEALEDAMHRAMSASQAKSEFLANMSHELRTPMSGILGMLDIVLDSRIELEQREHLQIAQTCAHTLLGLLNDILDLSKIEAGKMVLERIPFDIWTVVEDSVRAQSAKARQKSLDLRCTIDPRVPRQIISDPLRVRQILNNLLGNAMKFTDAGSVEVKLHGVPSNEFDIFHLELEVIDSGCGISEDKLPFIFEEFTQADGSISRKYGGTGLGLAITKRLVEMLGGAVTVDSTVGMGSRFSVALSCERADVEHAMPTAPAAARAGARERDRSGKILVVEDNPVNQKVVCSLLAKHGYELAVAADGEKALRLLEEERPALVLMDVQMPVLDGLETTRRIRRDHRYRNLPIVAMTAHAMNGDRERCLRAGMNDYVSKPVNASLLLQTVESYLELPPGELEARVSAVDHEEQSHRRSRGASEEQWKRNGAAPRRTTAMSAAAFMHVAPDRLYKLRSAASRLDAPGVCHESRKIRSAADRISAPLIAECALRIEEAACRGDLTQAADQITELSREVDRLMTEHPDAVAERQPSPA